MHVVKARSVLVNGRELTATPAGLSILRSGYFIDILSSNQC